MSSPPSEREGAALALVENLPPEAPLGLVLVAADGRVVTMSPSVSTLTGAPDDRHAGSLLADVLPAELGAAIEPARRAVMATGRPVPLARLEGRAPDGGERTWQSWLYPLRVSTGTLVGIVIGDVTIRARAERDMRESERQLAAAHRMAGMGWWSWTPGTDELVCSAELAAVIGLGPPADEGRLTGVQRDLVLPSGDAAVQEELAAAIRDERPFRFRHRIVLPDGHPRLIEAQGHAVVGAGGALEALHGHAQDITRLERAAARQRAVAELGRLALGGNGSDALLEDGCALVRDALWMSAVSVMPLSAAAEVTGHPDRAGVCVPVDTPHGRYGALVALPDVPRMLDEEEVAFLRVVAQMIGEAIGRRETAGEIAELAAARGRLVRQTLDAETRARRAIAEELHDGPLQEIISAGYDLYGLGSSPEAVAARERVQAIARDVRELMSSLHPMVQHESGLATALEAVAEGYGRTGRFAVQVQVEPEAHGVHDELVLSVVRHLLHEVGRHAGAGRVEVVVRRDGTALRLDLAHDGRPVPPGPTAERVSAMGGRLDVIAEPGGGTRVGIVLPEPGGPGA